MKNILSKDKERYCCSIGYYRLSAPLLKAFALNIRNKIGRQPNVFRIAKAYHDSVYNLNVLNNFQMAYANYFIDQNDESKDAYDKARSDLIVLLDASAEYVNSIAKGDTKIIKMAGFMPVTEAANIKKKTRLKNLRNEKN